MSNYTKGDAWVLVGALALCFLFFYLLYLKLWAMTGISWIWVLAPFWVTVLGLALLIIVITAMCSNDDEDWDDY